MDTADDESDEELLEPPQEDAIIINPDASNDTRNTVREVRFLIGDLLPIHGGRWRQASWDAVFSEE